jgi:hypothetical protein
MITSRSVSAKSHYIKYTSKLERQFFFEGYFTLNQENNNQFTLTSLSFVKNLKKMSYMFLNAFFLENFKCFLSLRYIITGNKILSNLKL